MKQHHRHKIHWKRMIGAAAIAIGLAGTLQAAPVFAEANAIHKAKEGDTFYLLAEQYGVEVNQLKLANPSISATNIYDGLDIVIPGRETDPPQAAGSMTVKGNLEEALPTLKVAENDKVVEAWGKSFNYSKTVDVKASAYSASAAENGGWGAVDYFGNPLQLGTIAVDPKVIPMGTKVLVTGHSHANLPKKAFVATATDQGGAIKGRRIDIFIPGKQNDVKTFGFQDVTLYILK
ncbi:MULTISPECIES: 3D domain-containing protein [Paenibacillus]|uniref:3D domain-containing protein n=1 Tax=Paenibacillus TaxID=44249 RepID=UPI002FE0BA21